MGDLIHLQAGIVGVAQHEQGIALPRGHIALGREFAEAHLAHGRLGLVEPLGGGGGAAAGRLDIFFDGVKLAVAQFGDDVDVGILVDADAGGDLGQAGFRADLECADHRRRVLVDDQPEAQRGARVPGGQRGAEGHRHDRRVFCAIGRI